MSADKIEKLKENMKKEWEKLFDEKIKEAKLQEDREIILKYWDFTTKLMNAAMTETLKSYEKMNAHTPVDNMNAFRDSWLKNCEKFYENAKKTQDFQKLYGDMLSQTLANWQAFTKV